VLVVSLALLERVYGDCWRSPVLLILGDSSYVLYLIHPYIVYGLLRAMWAGHTRLTWPTSTLVVVVLMAAATVSAVAIHLFIEAPTTGRLRDWLVYGVDRSAATGDRKSFRLRHRADPKLRTTSNITNALRRGLSHSRG
jgi:peptidoglycan/LPS O-acetylase OafA/YrhL